VAVLQAGQAQGTVTYGAGAKEGSGLGIGKTGRDGAGKRLTYDHIVRIATVTVATGRLKGRAEVFPP
jgi:hypothetical protein